MSKFEDGSYGSLTGITLIGKVLAGRCSMKYTRAAVGNGYIPENMTPKTMAGPADYVMDARIASVTNPVDGECQITVQIKSDDVETGFYATCIVLYAEDPDLGEIPYTYLSLENEPEWIRPASSIVGKLATFDLIAVVGDVDTVSAIIDPEAIATVGKVEQLISSAVSKRDLIIPITGWNSGAEESIDSLYVDITQVGVTDETVPIVNLLPECMETAQNCGLNPVSRTMDGKIRFYSEKVPDKEIHAELLLINSLDGNGGSGSIGGYVLPAATATRLGGVKIGENVDITEDGTISIDGADLLDDVAADDAEVTEMLNEVFGEESGA